jgi:hypothetical protein
MASKKCEKTISLDNKINKKLSRENPGIDILGTHKKMKKIVSLLMLVSLFAMTFGPALAVAQTEVASPITTALTQDTTGGANPIVKAKWEANGADESGFAYTSVLDYYMDDAVTKGAQFTPSGKYQVNKKIAICAIVTDPDGLADVTTAPGAVYADVFYPENVDLGDSHVALKNQSGLGCGELMQEDKLTKLSKTDGLTLFCGNVRTYNNNLPVFGVMTPSEGTAPAVLYNYDEICAETGELWKETAAVYCGTKDLSYEDPSGIYEVWAVAQDKVGLQGTLENSFTYLPVTAFETDFTAVNYGSVRLATHKIISGDLTWDNGVASVRNVGNTRLTMNVTQNDMGFGLTDGIYNVKYDARVGSNAAFANYYPNAKKSLADPLDLSELDEMDFSIDVTKFPPTHEGPYVGTMTLGATSLAHIPCVK